MKEQSCRNVGEELVLVLMNVTTQSSPQEPRMKMILVVSKLEEPTPTAAGPKLKCSEIQELIK